MPLPPPRRSSSRFRWSSSARRPASAPAPAPRYTGIYQAGNFPVAAGSGRVATNLGPGQREAGGPYGDQDGFTSRNVVPQRAGAHVPYSASQGHLGTLPCAQEEVMRKPAPYKHHRHLEGWRVGRQTREQIEAKGQKAQTKIDLIHETSHCRAKATGLQHGTASQGEPPLSVRSAMTRLGYDIAKMASPKKAALATPQAQAWEGFDAGGGWAL